MPQPLTTTLLAVAFLAVLMGLAPVAASFLAGAALVLEMTRFFMLGSDPEPQRTVLVKSGEPIPDEQGRTTLLRG